MFRIICRLCPEQLLSISFSLSFSRSRVLFSNPTTRLTKIFKILQLSSLMNMVSSNTKYIVKVKKFNVIGTLLKSASERNDKANIKAGGDDA